MNTLNDNITFLLEEKESNNINTDQLICELNLDLDLLDTEQLFLNEGDELYYNNNYNVKELLIICQYYGISKEVKISKCKKQDISSTIVFFESLPQNIVIVKQRKLLWSYLNELKNDIVMKKYVIWN